MIDFQDQHKDAVMAIDCLRDLGINDVKDLLRSNAPGVVPVSNLTDKIHAILKKDQKLNNADAQARAEALASKIHLTIARTFRWDPQVP